MVNIFVAEIMKREADAGAMTGSGGPTSPHKRYRQGDDELRLLIPSKVRREKESAIHFFIVSISKLVSHNFLPSYVSP